VSVTIVSPAKTAEPIEMPFGMWTWVGPRKHKFDGGAHWRNLVNMTEPSMSSGDEAFLSNYIDHLLHFHATHTSVCFFHQLNSLTVNWLVVGICTGYYCLSAGWQMLTPQWKD